MIEIEGNIFEEIGIASAICITTNCTFRNDNKKIEIIKRELVNIKLKAELLLRNSDIDLRP